MASGGRVLLQVNNRLVRELKSIGGAGTPEMVAAAKVLKKELKKILGVPGNGKPAPPGEPPRKQSGRLQKSVVSGIVGIGQRIGLVDFVALLQQLGYDTRRDPAGIIKEARRTNSDASLRKLARKLSRRSERAGRGKRGGPTHGEMKARPFFEQAMAKAEPKMVDVQVSAIRRRLPGGF